MRGCRRRVARRRREEERDGNEGDGVVRFYAVKDGVEKLGDDEGSGETDGERNGGELKTTSKKEALDAAGLRAEPRKSSSAIRKLSVRPEDW